MPLLNFPVLLALGFMPLTFAAAAMLRAANLSRNSPPIVLLKATGVALLAAAVITHLLFASLYLMSPGLTDHIEPTTAIVAWIYAQGGQVYHSLDAAERYAFLYGPVPYIATALFYKLLGPGALAAKLAGFICLLASMTFIALSVRRRFSGHLIPYVIALGYFSLVALFFKNHSFWSKPDPFMIAAAALGLYACLLRPGRMAWLVCGIALGIAVNAKVTGAVYFLPYLAWFLDRDGIRSPLVILPAAAVVALLPFLSAEQVSLANYLSLLQAAGDHGLSGVLLLQNTVFMLFLLAPVCCFLVWQMASVGIRSWFVNRKLVSWTSVVAALLILIAGSKPGSGPHHFLPFLPPLAFLAAHATSRVLAYRPTTRWSIYGYWAPVAAFLAAAVIKAGLAVWYGLQIVAAQANGGAIAEEVVAIMADNPQSHIYMGYGDGSRYVTTFSRTELAYANQPYLIDAAAIHDFQFSGIDIPQATIDRMLSDKSAIWLIPAGQEPFTMVSWYYQQAGKLLFDESFRRAFDENFRKRESRIYFDLYVPNTGTR